jgi:hypothetical protein
MKLVLIKWTPITKMTNCLQQHFFVILYFYVHARLTEVSVSHLLRNLIDGVSRIRFNFIRYKAVTHCARPPSSRSNR